MIKERWIHKRVWVKPWKILVGDKGFIGTITDIKESDRTPGLWLTKVEDESGDYRWLYPDEFITD